VKNLSHNFSIGWIRLWPEYCVRREGIGSDRHYHNITAEFVIWNHVYFIFIGQYTDNIRFTLLPHPGVFVLLWPCHLFSRKKWRDRYRAICVRNAAWHRRSKKHGQPCQISFFMLAFRDTACRPKKNWIWIISSHQVKSTAFFMSMLMIHVTHARAYRARTARCRWAIQASVQK